MRYIIAAEAITMAPKPIASIAGSNTEPTRLMGWQSSIATVVVRFVVVVVGVDALYDCPLCCRLCFLLLLWGGSCAYSTINPLICYRI